MSYDIYFINKKNLSEEEASEILSSDAEPNDDFFISKKLMKSIEEKLKQNGLIFETFEDDDYMEFNFDTFQVALHDNQICISLPYWEENRKAEVGDIVNKIANTLENSGMTGYDPQTEMVFSEDFDFNDASDILFSDSDDSNPFEEDNPEKKKPIFDVSKRTAVIITLVFYGLVIYGLIRLIKAIF